MFDFSGHISVYRGVTDNRGTEMPLVEFMNLGKNRYYADIVAYRTLKQTVHELKESLEGWINEDESSEREAAIEKITEDIESGTTQLKRIKQTLPCATLSGLFRPTRGDENLVSHSGFICVDIDDHMDFITEEGTKITVPQDMSRVPDILSRLPYIIWASHSLGGVGWFALVKLGPIDAEHTHEWYFDCLANEFSQYGIIIDGSYRSVSHNRTISYDSAPIRNFEKAVPFMGSEKFVSPAKRKRLEEEAKARMVAEQQRRAQQAFDPDADYRHIAVCVRKAIAMNLNICESYQDWTDVGFALASAFGERGRDFYHDLSSRSTKYKQSETDRKYSNLVRSCRGSYTIATLFSMFKQNNIYWYKD